MGYQDRDDIPGNTAHWFFAFFWLTEGSRNKKINIYIKTETPTHIFIKVFGYSGRHEDRKGVKTQVNPYFNLPPDIGFTLFTPIKGRIDSLTVYIYKAETCTYILRYNTCMSSYPGDRKWTKIEP